MLCPITSDGDSATTLLKKMATLIEAAGPPDPVYSSHKSRLAARAAPSENPMIPSYGPSSSITELRYLCTACTSVGLYRSCQHRYGGG